MVDWKLPKSRKGLIIFTIVSPAPMQGGVAEVLVKTFFFLMEEKCLLGFWEDPKFGDHVDRWIYLKTGLFIRS